MCRYAESRNGTDDTPTGVSGALHRGFEAVRMAQSAPREQRTDSPLVVAASSGIRLFGKGCAPSSMQDRLANLASLGSLFVTHWPSSSAAWLSWLRSSVNKAVSTL